MPEKIEIDVTEFENLTAEGKNITQAAEEMGIKPKTLHQRLATDTELRAARDRGQYRARQAGVTADADKPPAHASEPSRKAKKATRRGASSKRAAPANGTKTAGGGKDFQHALRAALLEFDYLALWGVPSPKAQEVRELLSALLEQ
jgi:hypothetical protein